MTDSATRKVNLSFDKFTKLTSRLDGANPINVLRRGFFKVYSDEKLLKNTIKLKKGDKIKIESIDTIITAEVDSVIEKENQFKIDSEK